MCLHNSLLLAALKPMESNPQTSGAAFSTTSVAPQAPQGPTTTSSTLVLVWSAVTMPASALRLSAPTAAGVAATMAEKPLGHKSDKSKSSKPKADEGKHDKGKEKALKQQLKHKQLAAMVTVADNVTPSEKPPPNILGVAGAEFSSKTDSPFSVQVASKVPICCLHCLLAPEMII